jgi:hypothetical protein
MEKGDHIVANNAMNSFPPAPFSPPFGGKKGVRMRFPLFAQQRGESLNEVKEECYCGVPISHRELFLYWFFLSLRTD